jgi:tetratricopeptide (TPR) repeat protein
MKLTITLLMTLLLYMGQAVAQTSNPSKQHYLDLYKRAIKYNDSRTAITALNGYLTMGDDAKYKDTLALIYYLSGEYYPSFLLTKEITDAEPENLGALERLASCYNQLGDVKAAVDSYEKLCPKTKNPYHYYQLATAQYQLKRVAECQQNLQRVIADTSSRRIPTSFDVGNGQTQNISVLAGAYNMLAVIQMEQKNYEPARQLFNKALEAFPDFVGAKQNLVALDNLTKKGGGGKPGPKPKGKG